MGLRINVSGLKFRRSDGKLCVAEKLKILEQRLSNPSAVRIRTGDNPADYQRKLKMRQPSDLKITQTHPIGIFQIKIPKMVQIPAGEFEMGSTEQKNEQPLRKVKISRFAIGQFEVTNEEFKAFLEVSGEEVPELVADPARARHPVVFVNWHDALAYAEWLKETTKRKFRLVTEAEGEYAARGPAGRKYPRGNERDALTTVFNLKDGPQPVDAHPQGDSPFGVMDLSRNVREWRADWYADKYDPEDLIDPKGPENGAQKVHRDGPAVYAGEKIICGPGRDASHPKTRAFYIGFRVAEDI